MTRSSHNLSSDAASLLLNGLAAGGLALGASFLAASLAAGPAPAPETPKPVPAERYAILPERLRITRDERPAWPPGGGWPRRPR